jgi:hypothetical protein
MGLGLNKICDHKDSNTLNNRRENLRECSAAQNLQNTRKRPGLSSRFKGVYWDKKNRKWMARVQHNRKWHYLGRFENERTAAKAYDALAKDLFGDFAKLNFP